MPVPPEILKRRETAATRVFRVEELELRFSNGAERTYERLKPSPHQAVLVVPVLDDDRVLLIREFGAGVGAYQLGLPKGAVDAGEDILAAANRELMEEVGYGARQLTFLKSLTLSPSYMGHTINVILAWDLYEQRLPGDEPEPLEVVPWSLSDLGALVTREDVTEARSIAALYMARDYLAQPPATR